MSQSADLRPSLSRYLHQRLTSFEQGFRHNLAVLGPAGSGKSLLLQQVLQSSPAKVTKIYCALQRDSVREFLKRFIAAVLHAIVEAPFHAPLEDLMRRAKAVAPKTVAAIEQLERYAAGHLPAEGFVRALDVIPVLHEECGRPCILVLDEFLHLEELGLSHAFHELGKRVMTWPYTLFLVTSSSTCRARQILRERLQLLFGQFELLSLGPIETAAATTWIHEQLPGTKAQPNLVRFLLHWIGAHPWYLNVLLTRAKERSQLKRERKLTDATIIQAAWDVLGSPDGVLHQWCAAQVQRIVHQRNGPLAREALVAIAGGARTTQGIAACCGTRRQLSDAVQTLVEHDLVHRKGACWVIPDQLFACWLVSVLRPVQARGSLDGATAFQLFDQALRAVWGEWQTASQQPLVERIGRLLTQFRNETVSLDHKTGRLPTFRTLATQQPSERPERYLVADGEQRRWCCMIHDGLLDEAGVTGFEQFCRAQSPRPSRKIVVAKDGLELNAKLLAKEANMWVWEPEDVNLLFLLYGQPTLNR